MSDHQRLMQFIAASPTPYHAVQTASEMLMQAGFERLEEHDAWNPAPLARRFVIRGDSSIIAFVVGAKTAAEAGFTIIGAHTDSPNLRLKPLPDIQASGYRQLGVEIYGGVLLTTWTDRDLGIAGRVMTADGQGGVSARIVRFDRPLARVPQLAIHLDREVNDRGLVLNKETHMRPIVGLGHGATFAEWLAAEMKVEPKAILGYDLMLHDLAPPTVSGFADEFIHAARLDNLASCHAALSALVESAGTAVPKTRVIALYDHEEIGSATAQGASGSFLEDVLERLSAAQDGTPGAFARAKARSFLVSADMAHAIHPNYAEKHDSRHAPHLNAGPVIKINANARYATDGETQALFANACRETDVPCQRFVMRSDMACGSTIGPLVATRLGIKTVDVGNPMLSMHSCRELAGTRDHGLMTRVLVRLFS